MRGVKGGMEVSQHNIWEPMISVYLGLECSKSRAWERGLCAKSWFETWSKGKDRGRQGSWYIREKGEANAQICYWVGSQYRLLVPDNPRPSQEIYEMHLQTVCSGRRGRSLSSSFANPTGQGWSYLYSFLVEMVCIYMRAKWVPVSGCSCGTPETLW